MDFFVTRAEAAEADLAESQLREQRIWARRVGGDLANQREVTLEGIDADWFLRSDNPRRGWLTRLNYEAREHLTALTIDAAALQPRQRWYLVTLGPASVPRSGSSSVRAEARESVVQYDTVVGPPVDRPLRSIRGASRADANRLGAAMSCSTLPPATVSSVGRALPDLTDQPFTAMVLDVGQGNWNLVVANNETQLSFDAGGPSLGYAGTWPSGFSSFPTVPTFPIVLSHWDTDHWAGAVEFPELQRHVWIVPKPVGLSPVNVVFLATLLSLGTVLVYPDHAAPITFGPIELAKANGKSKNESGLTLTLRRNQQAMLFPADAGYGNLDSRPATLTSVVIPHHGGRSPKSTPATIPICDGAAAGRAVMSCSDIDRYPRLRTAAWTLHRAWTTTLKTETRAAPGVPGHIELYWDSTTGRSTGPVPVAQR